jgi:acetyl esterase/lipase
MHGGGLVLLEGEGARRGALREAERLAIRTVSTDYRVPPDFPYPAALDNFLAVYQATLQDYEGYSAVRDVMRNLFPQAACRHKRMACPRKD